METLWFCLVAVMITLYVVLDGYDLGTGILHLFVARTDAERRAVLSLFHVVVNLHLAAADGDDPWQRRVSLAHVARHDRVGVDDQMRVTKTRHRTDAGKLPLV